MRPTAPHTSLPLTRSRLLHATLGGLTGLAAWHGWPSRHRALAQKGTPTGQMTWALHFTLTPQWFDPAETGGLLTLTIGSMPCMMPWSNPCRTDSSHPASRPHGTRVRTGCATSSPSARA